MKCRTPAMPGWRFVWTAAVLALCACTPSIDLQVSSDMQTANEMEAVLRQRAIGVERRQVKEGVVLSVADADFARAMSALREAGLPRQPRPRLGDTLGKKGAISTPLEERARYVHALEREIESTVLDIDGVVAARARVVPQQRVAAGAPLTPASASLLIKHRRDIDLSALLPGIVQLVKNGVPGLAAEDDSRVAVVLVPEQQTFAAVQAGSSAAQSAGSSIASPAGSSAWRFVGGPAVLVLAGGAAGYGLSRWRERRVTGQPKAVRLRDE